jgi:hypothetical protein
MQTMNTDPSAYTYNPAAHQQQANYYMPTNNGMEQRKFDFLFFSCEYFSFLLIEYQVPLPRNLNPYGQRLAQPVIDFRFLLFEKLNFFYLVYEYTNTW